MQISLTKLRPFFIPIVAIIVILLIIILGVFFSAKRTPSTSYQPTVPPLTNAKLSQPSGFEDQLSKLISSLPHTENGLQIEYFKPTNIVNVKITATNVEDFRSKKLKAEDFIKSKGVTDICKLNIFWVPKTDPELSKSLASDLRTTGCTPSAKPKN